MIWSDVEAFIAARSPKHHAAFRGCELAALARFEGATQTVLPGAYRAFLQSCGVSAAGLEPLGVGWAHDLTSLVSDPLDDELSRAGLLRVGVLTDTSALTPSDLFLDLTRAADRRALAHVAQATTLGVPGLRRCDAFRST